MFFKFTVDLLQLLFSAVEVTWTILYQLCLHLDWTLSQPSIPHDVNSAIEYNFL